ncbi:unnamed protein product [Camellia sinensis]
MWQLPNTNSSVLASTANELRRDKYTPINPEKLKAAVVGLSPRLLKSGFYVGSLECHFDGWIGSLQTRAAQCKQVIEQPRRSTDVFEASRNSTDRRKKPRHNTNRPKKMKTLHPKEMKLTPEITFGGACICMGSYVY